MNSAAMTAHAPSRTSWGQLSGRLPVYLASMLIGCIAGLGLMASGLLNEARGIGFGDLTIHFDVLDAATSSPIPGAVVQLRDCDPPGELVTRAETSALGTAEVTRTFNVASHQSLFRQGASFVIPDRWDVIVSSSGYAPTSRNLRELIGRKVDFKVAERGTNVVIRLDRVANGSTAGR
ncbi:hypothetical protein [Aquisphaera insulae]|uniref:hypothetical protein n=1 Tax=Aquisphaera insulae TaxID=2712864 RepID=UPI0013EA64D5|nr:hypothetical protein [Aquisphaera insulae]